MSTPDCFRGPTRFPNPPNRQRGADDVAWITWDMLQWFVNSVYDQFAACVVENCCGMTTPCVSFPDRVFDFVTAGHLLLGYWRFGEGAAPYADTSGMPPYDATVVTSIGFSPLDSDYTPGALPSSDDDGAVRFTGGGTTTGEYLKTTYTGPVADRFSLTGPTDYNTIAAWVRPEANAGTFTAGIVNHWSGSPASSADMGWRLGIQYPARTVVFTRKDGGSIPTSLEVVGPALPVDTWTFVVAVYDSTGMTLYYDGVQVATIAGTQGSLPGGINVVFGAESHQTGGTRYLPGAVDEVSIWGDPMTAGEIATLYTSGLPCGSCDPCSSSIGTDIDDVILGLPGLAAFWKLDELSGTTAHDSSGNGHDLTGSVTWGQPAGPPGTTSANWVDDTTRMHGPLTPFTDNFTAGVWINAHVDASGEMIGQGAGGLHATAGGWNIMQIASGPGYKFATGSNGVVLYANNARSLNTWYFVAVVRDAGTWKLYVNGLLQASTGTTSPASVDGLNTWLGNDAWPGHGTYLHDADLSYAFIANSVLTGTDLLRIYNAGVSGGSLAAGLVWTSDGAGSASWEPNLTTIAKSGSTPLTGDVTLSPGTGVTLTQAGQDISIAASSSGIPATIVDVKGDLIAASANDTVARLPVGSNDQVLVADSAQTLGVKWAAVPGTAAFVPVATIDAKGDLLVGTANDALDNLPVGADGQVLTADSAQTMGVKWAAAGGGGGGAWTLLSTTTLSVAGTFDVSSISGSYNDLILVMIARGARASAVDEMQLRFNNDSGANYYRENWYASGTTTTANQGQGQTSITTVGGGLPAASAPANSFAVYEIILFGYASTTWIKALHYNWFEMADVGTGGMAVARSGAAWNSTAAITRVQIQGSITANLVAGSQLRIYGRL